MPHTSDTHKGDVEKFKFFLDCQISLAYTLKLHREQGLFKKAVQQGRRQRGGRGVCGVYVEASEQRERSWQLFSTVP